MSVLKKAIKDHQKKVMKAEINYSYQKAFVKTEKDLYVDSVRLCELVQQIKEYIP